MAWPRAGARLERGYGLAWLGRIPGDEPRLLCDAVARRQRGLFAAVQATADSMVLSRSLFGGRSLYYARSGETVLACSRLGPFARMLGCEHDVDAEKLAHQIAVFEPEDESRSPFRRVKRVTPGQSLAFHRDGGTTASRATFSPIRERFVTADDWSHALRAEFGRAVERACAGKKRIGLLVSGGLDSSAILASLVALQRRQDGGGFDSLTPITLAFDAPRSDRPYLRSLAAALGVVPVEVAPRECAALAFAGMVVDGVPRIWPSSASDIHLLEVARDRGLDVLLTGIGGDFFWDLEIDSFVDSAVAGHWVRAVAGAALIQGTYWMPSRRRRVRRLVWQPLVRRLVPRPAWSFLRRALRRPTGAPRWAGPALRKVFAERVERSLNEFRRPCGREERMRDLAHSPLLASMADDTGTVEDRVGGCRLDHIFLDAEFAAFLASIPSDVVLRDHWLRGVLREAFRSEWPEMVRLRPDKGDFEPAFAVYLDGLRATGQLERLSEMRCLGDLGIVEPRIFREVFGNYEDVDARTWLKFWPALSIEAFLLGSPRHAVAGDGAIHA
jgi:asparagine synthetase B (glutamine-hydrolysing)